MLEMLARDKHSSLIQTFVNHRHKSFITLTPGHDPAKKFSYQESDLETSFHLPVDLSEAAQLVDLARDDESAESSSVHFQSPD